MTDKELLVVSVIGTIVFYLVTRYINKRATGTENELKTKKRIRSISIIYGIGMTIQIISLIDGIMNDQ
jgi:hypothetical protein